MRFKTLKTLAGMALLGLAVVFLSGCPNRQRGTVTEVSEPTAQPVKPTPPETEQSPAVEVDPNAWKSDVKDVFFDYDKAELRSDARMILQENVRYLKEHAGADLTLEGHCDERGTDEYNLALGQRRADAVRTYLVDLGVSGTRLKTVSFGEERPFALGSDESAWSQNRRVHFVIK
jgi:peptidoglycan-associated lipoprotein